MHREGMCYHRRRFLRQAGSAALAAPLAAQALGHAPLGRHGLRAAEAAAPGPVDVGIARGGTMEDAVRHAVELSGGLDFIQPGQSVLIKPNVTGGGTYPTTTNPEVLYAVIKLVNERGPRRILVGDRSFSPLFIRDPELALTAPKTVDVMKRVGHIDAIEQAKSDCQAPVVACGFEDPRAEFEALGMPADTPHWRKLRPELATHWPDGFELAELLFAVDHVINVPVIKTHFQAWFTMSMKAFVGMSHHRTRREFHSSLGGSETNDLFNQRAAGSRRRRGEEGRRQEIEEVTPFVNRISELNLGIRPALNILDGTRSFVFGGPSQGDTVDPKVVVASRDRIAADATGVALLKRYGTEFRLQRASVWDNPFIRHAIDIGLGIDSLEKLNLKHTGMDDDIEQVREMLV